MVDEIAVPVLDQGTGKELTQVVPGKEVVKTMSESTEIFQLMEARDEEQMLKEVMGVFSKEYVYDIPFLGGNTNKCSTPGCPKAGKQNHTHVRGLSWSGIKEARRIFKAIDTREVSKPIIVEHDNLQYYECKVTAVDLRTGNVTTTYKRHPLQKKRKDGSLMEDPYAFEVVQSKAKRNAISELLPQPLVRGWIGDWVAGKKDFDPKRALDLEEGEGFTVEKETKRKGSKANPTFDQQQRFSKKDSPKAKLPKTVLDKLLAVLKDFEAKGGLKAEESTRQYCAHFKVTDPAYISVDQANKIMDAVNARIAKIKADKKEHEKGADGPGSEDIPVRSKAQNIQLIKDKLTELGWDLKDPKLVASLLKPFGLASVADIQRADDVLVQQILDKVSETE